MFRHLIIGIQAPLEVKILKISDKFSYLAQCYLFIPSLFALDLVPD